MYFLYVAGLIGAFLSTKEKGLKKWNVAKNVNEYKFPYTFNPLKAFYRSLKTVRYLSKVWDIIPNYMNLENENEKYKEITEKIKISNLTEKEKNLTKEIVEEIYQDCLTNEEKEIYLKHEFIPYFYSKARNLFL